MDDAGPRSLFVLLHHPNREDSYFSILQLGTQVSNHEYAAAHLTPEHILKTKVVYPKDYVVRFNEPQRENEPQWICWFFSPPTSSNADLYMVPCSGMSDCKTVNGYKFNFRTGRFLPINPPMSFKTFGHVVNVKGHIYFLAYIRSYCTLDAFFRCYDPDKKSWKALKPLPDDHCGYRPIVGTAVWGDTILFNVASSIIWAYDVSRKKWYPVDVEDDRCYSIIGEAIVVENTIYALTFTPFALVLALSIEIEESGGDLVFKCSVRSEILVKGMNLFLYEDHEAWMRTRHLVHLGKDNFCLVHSCIDFNFHNYQPIQVTYMKLKGENLMIVIDECVHEVHDNEFHVLLSFSLPECKTTALKEGKSFHLDPFLEDYASIPVQEGEIGTLHKDRPLLNVHGTSEQGHSIYVRKLPPNATVRQLEKGLKKFGRIKRDGIQVGKNKKGKCYAFVEFESATSKQRAIEVSTIRIGGCPAEILEKS